MMIYISQYFLNIMKGILRVTELCEISVFIERNIQTFLSISSRTPDIFPHHPHTSIVRPLEHLWNERARENFTVDLQQRFHYPLCEKMDFIARGITPAANGSNGRNRERIGRCLSSKYVRNLTREIGEAKFHRFICGMKSSITSIASGFLSLNLLLSIDHRLSIEFPLLRLSIVVFHVNSLGRCFDNH